MTCGSHTTYIERGVIIRLLGVYDRITMLRTVRLGVQVERV